MSNYRSCSPHHERRSLKVTAKSISKGLCLASDSCYLAMITLQLVCFPCKISMNTNILDRYHVPYIVSSSMLWLLSSASHSATFVGFANRYLQVCAHRISLFTWPTHRRLRTFHHFSTTFKRLTSLKIDIHRHTERALPPASL